MRWLMAFALTTRAALADPALTAEEFDALTQGSTMTWSEAGQVYGVEQYLPGRKVRWTFLGDDCKDGTWYPQGDAICFLYDGTVDPVCWRITRSGSDLLATVTDAPPGAAPVMVSRTTAQLACFGPQVGV
jgi:hypothetical protein